MPPSRDWTTGPAKWAAVAVLGAASVGGLGWSILNRDRGGPAVLPRATGENTEAAVGAAPPLAPLAAAPAEPAHAKAPRARALTRVIDLNTASAAELDLLPGIGPAMAARILEYRAQHGPFTSVDQLDQVKGIGVRTLEKLRPLVKVEPASQPAPAAPEPTP